ncbi:MAG TPA: tetratricopeptide repeat protein, partial [Candidatus Obscuribacterales bacterium]
RFSETILPEDAKAKQLAMLVKSTAKGEAPQEPPQEEATDQKVALATAFQRLAQSYCDQGNYADAQQVYERILVNRMNELGPNHPELTVDLTNLAGVLCAQGKFNQAEPFMRRTVSILENVPNVHPLKLADALGMLGEIYFRQDKYFDSEDPLLKALQLRQDFLGENHPDVADSLSSYAKLLRKTNRQPQAEKLYAQAQEILAKRNDESSVPS